MNKSNQLYQLIWMSRPLMQAAETLVERNLNGTGLTVRMRAVLEVIARYGSLSVPEIANHLHINRQYVQVMVNETIAQGFTQKMPNPRHQKSVLIALTETGDQLIGRVMSLEQNIVSDLAVDFDEAKIDDAHKLMSELLTALQADKKKEQS